MLDRVLIAGGGVAAHHAAVGLRDVGYERSLTVLAREHLPPYDRTLVSKDLLTGAVAQERLLLDVPRRYEELGIDLRLGSTAVALDPQRQRVVVDSGAEFGYDALVIATGARARRPRALTPDGVHTVRNVADGVRLRQSLDTAESVAIIGGGFLGLELASAACQRGIDVHVIEAAPEPLAVTFGLQVGRLVRELHEARGVRFLCAASPSRVVRANERWRVAMAHGEASIDVDVVVTAVGMEPNTGWLSGTGLVRPAGVLVDNRCRTILPAVFACGDCAAWPDERTAALTRAEHWDVAGAQGAAVALELMGIGREADSAPYFWSDQHGVKLQFVGQVRGHDEVFVDREAIDRFTVRYERAGLAAGVLAAGRPGEIASARRELGTAPGAAQPSPAAAPSSAVAVDRALCIGSGNCTRLARGVFALDDDGIATVLDTGAAPAEALQRAARSCPAGAIHLGGGAERRIP
jgi:NADPH-dependent 2,4-dienoyl-CoA reductase/sulfur reductase-like enzyme/ferredoxin